MQETLINLPQIVRQVSPYVLSVSPQCRPTINLYRLYREPGADRLGFRKGPQRGRLRDGGVRQELAAGIRLRAVKRVPSSPFQAIREGSVSSARVSHSAGSASALLMRCSRSSRSRAVTFKVYRLLMDLTVRYHSSRQRPFMAVAQPTARRLRRTVRAAARRCPHSDRSRSSCASCMNASHPSSPITSWSCAIQRI